MVKSEASGSAQLNAQHAAQALSASAKRKKLDELDTNGSSKKKPRTRVSYSCGECHRRKQKCDRQVPCSHCIARKVPELCKAYTPGKSDQDIHARLTRLEQIIDVALPQYSSSGSIPGSPSVGPMMSSRQMESGSMTPEDDEGSQAEEGDVAAGTFDGGGKWYGNSVSGSVAPATMLEQLNHVAPSHDSRHRESSRGTFPHFTSSAHRPNENGHLAGDNDADSPILQKAEPTAADLLQSLILDCGLSETAMQDLLDELPPRPQTDDLIDHYFKTLNWTRYPISEQDFRTSYAALFVNGVGSNANDIRFLPLLFVVLAIAARLSPEDIGGDAQQRKIRSMRFYWSSRRALLIAAAIQPDSLEMVLTRLLSARYLTFDRRITECWSQLGAAVCTAQALGLHRDPAGMRLELAQVEYRRRIWAYLYHADRSYSMVLGRPYAIQDEYHTTLPPLNIEDLSTLSPSSVLPPLSTPTRMTFVILRHGLAYLIGKMVHYFQRVRIQNHYHEVLALDDDLQKFIDALPPHFSFTPDTSLDNSEEFSYIPVHRYLLTTEILFVRISLHRPYILRRLDSDRYYRSRRACFDAALKDFEVRQAYRSKQPKEAMRSVSNAYREFQTAMVSGIYLVLDPNGKDAQAMHAILDTFLRDHEGVGDLDDTTRRELKIVQFLKSKAIQAETTNKNGHKVAVDASPTSSVDNMDAASANILLSLQRSQNAHLHHHRSASEGTSPGGPMHGPYSTLASSNNMQSLSTSSTPAPFIGPMPAFARLPHHKDPARHSPSGTGSPRSADEDMAAQNMLDHWCNAVTNPPPLLLDGFGNGNSLSSGQWGTFSTGVGDMSSWLNTPYLLGNDAALTNGVEGADYSYWESLVNTIRSNGPAQ